MDTGPHPETPPHAGRRSSPPRTDRRPSSPARGSPPSRRQTPSTEPTASPCLPARTNCSHSGPTPTRSGCRRPPRSPPTTETHPTGKTDTEHGPHPETPPHAGRRSSPLRTDCRPSSPAHGSPPSRRQTRAMEPTANPGRPAPTNCSRAGQTPTRSGCRRPPRNPPTTATRPTEKTDMAAEPACRPATRSRGCSAAGPETSPFPSAPRSSGSATPESSPSPRSAPP